MGGAVGFGHGPAVMGAQLVRWVLGGSGLHVASEWLVPLRFSFVYVARSVFVWHLVASVGAVAIVGRCGRMRVLRCGTGLPSGLVQVHMVGCGPGFPRRAKSHVRWVRLVGQPAGGIVGMWRSLWRLHVTWGGSWVALVPSHAPAC